MKTIMKDFLPQIVDLVKTIVDRYGVKSLVALGGIAALWDLTKGGSVPGNWGAIAIAAIVVGYFVVRRMEHNEVGICHCDPDDEPDKEEVKP